MKLTLHKIDSAGEYVYHVSAVTADQTLWADAGHEIAFAQEVFEVKDNQNSGNHIAKANDCIRRMLSLVFTEKTSP